VIGLSGDIALVDAFADTWNRHDMKGMSATTTMVVQSTTTNSIAPNVKIIVASMVFSAIQDPRYPWVKPSSTKCRGSFTAVKRDGAWKLVHFQDTIIDPNAENVDVPSFDAEGFSGERGQIAPWFAARRGGPLRRRVPR
jgi:hypothetical protein